ncbi:DsbA family oxidoreductase [Salisediminibacterium beveridgei]|uniref:Dithiol-disulfide isomerase n=1 Tax=Salisediminibacterium beveridgei TaxID=632773 RepID=A0A1D7QZJ7_9BACI|nr:DsbA family protein [Salisediminibacterium beveridgei]AOM84441.1 hypothetical protein BBEV_3124 [Salisediminibacterium beveridgei]
MKKTNDLLFDIETGISGDTAETSAFVRAPASDSAPVILYYVTDPICSHCWAIEPVLRRFLTMYQGELTVRIVMGGLLEKWHGGPVDPANGIHGPEDVAGHWREVGEHARMPIDGSLMKTNPLASSYPPSRVFKVVETIHGKEAAVQCLRRMREALFIGNRNIGEATVLREILSDMGLDGERIVTEADGERGHALLMEDFALARSLRARAFPTIIMVNEKNEGVRIVGGRPLETYIDGLKKLRGKEVKAGPVPDLPVLLKDEQLLFAKEIEVLYEVAPAEAKAFVERQLSEESYEIQMFLSEWYVRRTN